MILGQSAPPLTTNTDVYTVPEKTVTVVRVLVCELGGAAASYRIAVRPLGAALSNEHYVVYNRAIPANGDQHTVPIEMGATDVLTVWASTGDLSFTVTGVEEPEVE